MKKNQVEIDDKVICKRNPRDDKRFKHEFVGLVIKKLEKSAIVIICLTLEEDDEAMYDAHGVTVVPYREMKIIREGENYCLK